ncbi:MAG: hypothetical protein AAGF59_02255 [Pseudomonadota bacterium]
MKKIANGLLITAIYIIITFGFLEVSLRVWFGQDVFALTNYRAAHEIDNTFAGVLEYDANLGWSMRPNMEVKETFGTLEYGIRRNAEDQTEIAKGGILVSGSSFTAGSGASDAETWPAELQQMDGRPVHNAAIGGFGFDQVVLRAEDLLDAVEPDVLMVDIMQTTVSWTGYSVLGRPKPYFVVENGALERPEPIVPLLEFEESGVDGLRHYAAYSFLIDRVMSAIDAQAWYAQQRDAVVNAPGDPVEVSCALLRRLAIQTIERGIRLVVVSIPTGQELLVQKAPASVVSEVEKCARSMNIQVAPVREQLTQDLENGTADQADLYMAANDGTPTGHMLPAGNAYIAGVVYKTLGEPSQTPEIGADTAPVEPAVSSSAPTTNLLSASEDLTTTLTGNPAASIRQDYSADTDLAVFELSARATEPQSKPLLSTRPINVTAGYHVLAFDIDPQAEEKVTALIATADGSGITTGFDFRRGFGYVLPSHKALGRQWKAGIENGEDAWKRVWLRLWLPDSTVTVNFGLGDEYGNLKNPPEDTRARVRRAYFGPGTEIDTYIATHGALGPVSRNADGPNLIDGLSPLPALLASNSHMSVNEIPVPGAPGPSLTSDTSVKASSFSFELKPVGEESEHYVGLVAPVSEPGGPVTLALEVQTTKSSPLRVQMLNDGTEGVLADFNFQTESVRSQPVGGFEAYRATLMDGDGDWRELRLTVRATGQSLTVLFQGLTKDGDARFTPTDEKVFVRNIRLVDVSEEPRG